MPPAKWLSKGALNDAFEAQGPALRSIDVLFSRLFAFVVDAGDDFREVLGFPEVPVHAGKTDITHSVNRVERFHGEFAHPRGGNFTFAGSFQSPDNAADHLFDLFFRDRALAEGNPDGTGEFFPIEQRPASIGLYNSQFTELDAFNGCETLPASRTGTTTTNGCSVFRRTAVLHLCLGFATERAPHRLLFLIPLRLEHLEKVVVPYPALSWLLRLVRWNCFHNSVVYRQITRESHPQPGAVFAESQMRGREPDKNDAGMRKGIRTMEKGAVLGRYLASVLGVSMLVCISTGYADSTQPPHEDELATKTDDSRFAGADMPEQHAVDDVVIKNTWMQHVGEGQHYVAAYFELENNSDTSYLIDRISSSSCTGMFGYHSDLEVGTLTRQLFTHLTLPAKQMLVFPPGGYHLVCKVADGKTINQGMSIPVQFHFLGGSEKNVNFEVRSARVHRPVGVSYNKLK